MSEHIQPTIVPKGDHFRYTPRGVVMAGEFSRAAVPSCDSCTVELPVRLVADEPLGDRECDELLTSYLEGAGWVCSADGDLCPNCRPGMRAESGTRPAARVVHRF